VGRYILGDE